MNNPETTLATFGTRHKTKTSKTNNTTQHRKLQRWTTRTPPKTGM